MESPAPRPRRRRELRAPPRPWWLQVLDVMELSSPQGWLGLGLVLVLLVIGFGPLLLLAILDVSGPTRRVLVALGPVGICLGLAGLVLVCGYRLGESLGWSRRQTWSLAALFAGLGLLGGLGLWLGEG